MTGTPLDQATLDLAMASHDKFLRGVPGGRRLILNGRDASNLRFRNSNLTTAEMVGTKLHYAQMSGTILARANLFGADLFGADLRKADLNRADMRGVSLRRTNLDSANLTGADIRDAVLMGWDRDTGISDYRPNHTGTVI